MRFETLACNVNICNARILEVVVGPARVCGHLEAVREKDVPLVHKHRGEGGEQDAASLLGWSQLQDAPDPASLLAISPEAVTGGVPPQGLAVTCRIRTEVINCPPLTDDNTGPPGPGHTDVDPPGLGEEAELPGVVGPDHAQDDHLLLPALVAVHSPHLHPAQAGPPSPTTGSCG